MAAVVVVQELPLVETADEEVSVRAEVAPGMAGAHPLPVQGVLGLVADHRIMPQQRLPGRAVVAVAEGLPEAPDSFVWSSKT